MKSTSRISLTSTRAVIYSAILGDLLIALVKIIAASVSGSSAMFSEGVHSIVDSGNGFLLLYGLRRGASRADDRHPLGYGREIYFWSFVVAVLLFAFGAGVSFYEGALHIQNPQPVQHVVANYVVLAASAIFDGTTWWIALRAFKLANRTTSVVEAIRDSKDPPSFVVIFEDSAALIGVAIAATGIFLSSFLALPVLDGVASLLIGVVLASTAVLLARETKSLLIGEPADRGIIASILRIAKATPGIANANGILTVHLAPAQILVALSVEFADELNATQIEARVAELETRVRHSHPEVVALFVKPQSAQGYGENLRRRSGADDASSGARSTTNELS
jgi:cation diffusion facilitator family transporter